MLSNWKAPGPDLVQGYWLTNFTNIHDIQTNNLPTPYVEVFNGIYIRRNLHEEEQKGLRKQSRGTHDLLFIYESILRNARDKPSDIYG